MITIDLDTREAERAVGEAMKSQLPFGIALGINDTLNEVKEDAPAGFEADLDRPTPFTKRGLFVQRASKRKLYGVVGVKDRQAEYLGLQASGGRRNAKGRAVVVPVGIRLNKYGNMPRGGIKRSIARPDTFSGTVKGVAGVWQRKKKPGGASRSKTKSSKATGIRLLAVYKDAVNYSARLQFERRGARLVERRITPNIERRLRQAIRTARK